MASPESTPPALILPQSVRLESHHHSPEGVLSSIGYFNGEIGIADHNPDDLRPTVIGLTAADLPRTQVTAYLARQPQRPELLAPYLDRAYELTGLNQPGGLLRVVSNAWRKGFLYVKEPITLPTQYAPELVEIPKALKRIIGSLLTGNSVAVTAQLEDFANLNVEQLMEGFKDILGVKSDAAALSFGLLALKRRPETETTSTNPPVVAKPQPPSAAFRALIRHAEPDPAPAVAVTQPEVPIPAEPEEPVAEPAAPAPPSTTAPPPTRPVPIPKPTADATPLKQYRELTEPNHGRAERMTGLHVYDNTDGLTVVEHEGFTIGIDLQKDLSCPRSSAIVAQGLLGATMNTLVKTYQTYLADVKEKMASAYWDVDSWFDDQSSNNIQRVYKLIESGRLQFTDIPEQPNIRLDDWQMMLLSLLGDGYETARISQITNEPYDKVCATVRDFKHTFNVPTLELVTVAAYAHGLLPLPEGAKVAPLSREAQADSTVPELYPPAVIDGKYIHWAGGILETTIPYNRVVNPQSVINFLHFCCDRTTTEIKKSNDSLVVPGELPVYTLNHYKLPTRINAAIGELFARKWLRVEQYTSFANTLYPQEETLIRNMTLGQKPADAAEQLDMTEKAYFANIRDITQVLGVRTTHGVVTLSYMAGLLQPQTYDYIWEPKKRDA